jgi:hypothetical protein
MKFILTILFTLFYGFSYSQKIINYVFVGDSGITENIEQAHSFILIKKFPSSFQRLDYKLKGPLIKEENYSDSTLEILEGMCYEYHKNGALLKSGEFNNNLKEKDWKTYNDTGKVLLIDTYEKDVLIKSVNPDTLKKEPEDSTLKKDEQEANFGEKDNDWKSFLFKNLDVRVIEDSNKGGTIWVGFTIDTSGKCVNIYMKKSVEFVLDDEGRRILEISPLWKPSILKGKKIKADRIQPLTFFKQ